MRKIQAMKKLIALLALSLISLALIADENLIAKLDSDNNGRISIEEAAEDVSLAAMISELGINKDGYLSISELDNEN
tara:strand:- start:781 stop:1011 length:231 start_codon:yes stop_codon:yes gene_type:complete